MLFEKGRTFYLIIQVMSYNGYILPIRSNCKGVDLNKTHNLLGQ